MVRFLMRRLVLFVLALMGISLLIFLALRILPGDVAAVMAGLDAPPERVDRLRRQMGLDRSYPRQYLDWVSGFLQGDLGRSILTNRSIASQVGIRAQITFPLILLGLGVALLLGIPLGCAAALARSPRMQSFSHMVAIVGGSVPALWSGLLLIMLFAKGGGLIGLLPSQGFPALGWAQPGQALAALILPAVSTGIIVGAGIMRYTRSLLGDMLSSGYVDMGMACGMTRTQAALRIGLRLASPQLVSVWSG